jgi:hypothetical protein
MLSLDLFDREDAGLPVGRRIRRAVRRWLTLAVYLSLVAAVVYALSDGMPLKRVGLQISLIQLIGLYFVGCAVAGVIAGALTPLAMTLPGSLVAACVSLFPVGVLMEATFFDLAPSDPLLWLSSAIFACAVGLVYGAIDWSFRDRQGDP